MKKLVTIFVGFILCIIPFIGKAQNNPYYERGTIGYVEGSVGFIQHSSMSGSISCGYGAKLGNGVYMGLGLGAYYKYYVNPSSILFPYYLEGKYSFLNDSLSPFVSARVGGALYSNDTILYLSPAIGFSLNEKWAIDVRYEYMKASYDNSHLLNSISIGVSRNF